LREISFLTELVIAEEMTFATFAGEPGFGADIAPKDEISLNTLLEGGSCTCREDKRGASVLQDVLLIRKEYRGWRAVVE
jgi:hypothetical protein